MKSKFVAIIDSEFVRDAQIMTDPNDDPDDEKSWVDCGGSGDPQVFLGIYEGTEEQARSLAAQEADVDEDIVTLIPVPAD